MVGYLRVSYDNRPGHLGPCWLLRAHECRVCGQSADPAADRSTKCADNHVGAACGSTCGSAETSHRPQPSRPLRVGLRFIFEDQATVKSSGHA